MLTKRQESLRAQGNAIRRIRTSRFPPWTQEDFSARLGVYLGTLRLWERGLRRCPPRYYPTLIALGGSPSAFRSDADRCPYCGQPW
jgi:DNA-binding transcriptional regulator YiaG